MVNYFHLTRCEVVPESARDLANYLHGTDFTERAK